jgi:tetratricopeptide (TPR) repeat protein
MSSISLCMIVKDESRVIERCLRSVVPFISAWTVVDTGSSDDTPERVQAALGHLPGRLHHRSWRNFAENRSEALWLNRELGDYHLVVDADDWLEAEPHFQMPDLEADWYSLDVRLNAIRYQRPQLLRAGLPWRYEGVVHEYAHCAEATRGGLLEGLHYVCGWGEGARSRNPDKYLIDAQLLEAALAEEPDHPRNRFYLAQSYRDAGLWAQAAEAYQRRARLQGWVEERYVAHLERARLLRRLQTPAEQQAELLQAYELIPQRAEALVELAQFHRELGQWNQAHLFAARAAELKMPAQGLFLEESVYRWRAQDELALAEFYTGRFREARQRTQQLLGLPGLPEIDQLRLQSNLLHCLEREGRLQHAPV